MQRCLNSVLNVKALVGAFNQEKALEGDFSVIVKPMEHYTALIRTTLACHTPDTVSPLQLWCVLVAHCPQIQSPQLRRERLGNGDSSKTAQFVIKRLIKS